MAEKNESLRFRQQVQAPPAEVFRAFTHATALRDWLAGAASSAPHPGGHIFLQWPSGYRAAGAFTALEPGKTIAFTWHGSGEPEASRVRVSLAEKNGGTSVSLTHAGLGRGKKWAEAVEQIRRGWEAGLENLKSVLEDGIDLRQARLPRMGILMDEFNADIAARLGVPVTQGVRLVGTAEGSGAAEAGLQADDVLVRMAGVKLRGFADLGQALQGKQAEQLVPLTFYRGAEKRTVQLRLSSRPAPPPLPESGPALAARAREIYAAYLDDMARRLEGVSEAEAERRPAPNEWNLKELVAHFVACERDLQSWIADLVVDNVSGDSLQFRPNVTPRLAVLAERYNSLPALLAELRAAADETIALLEQLPPAFTARRHLFRRVVDWVTQVVPTHLPDEHGAQLDETLKAARAQGG